MALIVRFARADRHLGMSFGPPAESKYVFSLAHQIDGIGDPHPHSTEIDQVVSQRRLKCQAFIRQIEYHTPGMQCLPAVSEFFFVESRPSLIDESEKQVGWDAVDLVTHHGEPDMLGMGSDLVLTAGRHADSDK